MFEVLKGLTEALGKLSELLEQGIANGSISESVVEDVSDESVLELADELSTLLVDLKASVDRLVESLHSKSTVEVGMWYCEPRNGIENFDADLKLMADGGVTIMESWDAGQIYADRQGHSSTNWAEYQGKGWAGWVKHIDSVNQTQNLSLKTLLFKPTIWPAVATNERGISEIDHMVGTFKQHHDAQADSVIGGVSLSDDFAKYEYNGKWNQLITTIGAQLGENTRFFITNQLYDPKVFSETAPRGSQMDGLRKWIDPFQDAGYTVVYLPQYYPWAGSEWNPSNRTQWYEWLEGGIRELVRLRRSYPETLEIQPILQASAWGTSRGPSHSDMHRQIKTSLAQTSVNGVWLIGWNNPSFPHSPAFWDASNHFGKGRKYDEAIQCEVRGGNCTEEGS